jgi:hypothetical protein
MVYLNSINMFAKIKQILGKLVNYSNCPNQYL